MAAIHWANPVDGNFTTATDWAGGVVPGPSDDAILDASGADYMVTVNSAQTVDSIQTGSNAALEINGGSLSAESGTGGGANAGKIIVESGGSFSVADTVNNTGTIELINGSTIALGSNTTLGGGGAVALSDSSSNVIGDDGSVSVTLTNVDNTIFGSGEFNPITGNLTLINDSKGVIDATGDKYELYLTTTTNIGTLEATGAAGLGVGRVKNAGGVILAATGSKVQLFDVISGGSLETTGTGVIQTAGARAELDGSKSAVTISGKLETGNSSMRISGSIINSGEMILSASGAYELSVLAGGATLAGGGTVVMGGPKDDITSRPLSSSTTLTNLDNTISGVGFIGEGKLTFVNEAKGVVDAVGQGTLLVNTSGATLTNAGILEATGGGRLAISSTTVDQAGGGTIQAAAGASAMLNDADIVGGTIGLAAGGVVFTSQSGGLIDGRASTVALPGRLDVQGNSTITLVGSIDNAGQISLLAEGAAAELMIGAAGATLAGGGQVIIRKNASDRITGASAAATLTNLDNVIIGEAGDLGGGTMTLVNEAGGIIRTDTGTSLTIDTGANSIVNAGLIAATSNGTLTVKSAIANSGTLSVGGGDLVLDGAVSGAGSAIVNGGTLDAAAAFGQSVTFGKTGELILSASQGYGGTISGFSHSGATSLDLQDIAFVSGTTKASYSGTTSGGTLTVTTDGTHKAEISLLGNYTTAIFTVSSDGHGGTFVTDPAKGASPVADSARGGAAVAHLVQAAARFPVGPALRLEATPAPPLPRLLLAAPHA